MAKITGIGGIFFKSEAPTKLKEWYAKNLGLSIDQYGTSFEWKQASNEKLKGFTQWSVMDKATDYIPKEQSFMINYRVDNLAEYLKELKEKGILPVDSVEDYDYGKFVHVKDGDGNLIELWEPVDTNYDSIVEARTLS